MQSALVAMSFSLQLSDNRNFHLDWKMSFKVSSSKISASIAHQLPMRNVLDFRLALPIRVKVHPQLTELKTIFSCHITRALQSRMWDGAAATSSLCGQMSVYFREHLCCGWAFIEHLLVTGENKQTLSFFSYTVTTSSPESLRRSCIARAGVPVLHT